ncbi:MAG TPA: hypothetical protein VK939_05920 [Longimicrobiales bacterium]|nr:hypothetical protein [Longimicrobiales bacterium]
MPEIGEPFFYLVLYPGRVWDSLGEGSHYAMALTIHSAVDVRCRTVQSLAMTQASNDAPFAWRTTGFCDEVFATNPSLPGASCCTLPFAHPDSLGAEDLRAGETYSMSMRSESVIATGRTTIPGPFSVHVVRTEDGWRAVWSRSPGAGGYSVTDGDFRVTLTQDSSLLLPAAGERFIHVEALDENLYRYLQGTIVRSGIDAGQGVFGAMWSPGPVSY